MSIRIGILGYGNLGRGVECAVKQNPDMELKAVFTRRDPETVKILTENAKVYRAEEAERLKRRDRRAHSLRRKRNGSAGADACFCQMVLT